MCSSLVVSPPQDDSDCCPGAIAGGLLMARRLLGGRTCARRRRAYDPMSWSGSAAREGRTLSYVEREGPEGVPLLVCHADAAADIEAIADQLGFDRFAVVGASGGAPHALACGALLGERILRVAALVTPAPADTSDFDFFAGLAELNVKECSSPR